MDPKDQGLGLHNLHRFRRAKLEIKTPLKRAHEGATDHGIAAINNRQ